MNKQMRGFGFYIVIALIVFATIYFMSPNETVDYDYSYTAFKEDLEAKKISKIEIKQNKEIPTGRLIVTFNDGETKIAFNEDITKLTEDLRNRGVDYDLYDVERDSFFITTIVPIIIAFILIMVVFNFISNKAGAGGGGNKMMSFGKIVLS